MRYTAIDDAGTVLNPLLFDGQIRWHRQGASQILMEDITYDCDTGQLVNASFMDYCMPRADDFCDFNIAANEVPTARNPLGVKGVGEAGTVGAMPAVMNAIRCSFERWCVNNRDAGDFRKGVARTQETLPSVGMLFRTSV